MRSIMGATCLVTVTTSVPVFAGFSVHMDIDVTTDGGAPVFSDSFALPEIFSDGGVYQFDPMNAPELAGQDFSVEGPVTVGTGLAVRLLATTLDIANRSDSPLRFTITLTTDSIAGFGSGVGEFTTTSSWNLSGGPNPEFSSLSGMHLWTASAGYDGDAPWFVGELHPDPQSMNLDDGLTIPAQSFSGLGFGGDPLTQLSITLAFELSPGAVAGVNGMLSPSPGGLALLGLAVLVGRRRRRD